MPRQIVRMIEMVIALWVNPAMAASHMGMIEHEDVAGRMVLHRAVCARDTRPLHMHCHAHILVRADGNPMSRARMITGSATFTITPSGYGPADLRNAYRLAVTGSSTTIIAIVDAYGYPGAESDLAIYRAEFGLPPCTRDSGCFTRINQRGTAMPPQTDTGWAQEQALDVEPVRCAPIAASC